VPTNLSVEDQLCEDWFNETTTRESLGRFSVALPFCTDILTRASAMTSISVDKISKPTSPSIGLGDSYFMAMKRFFNLESRLNKDPMLYESYRQFMDEYVSLGHMKVTTRPGLYYIPHHSVVKQEGQKSKLRVVFDASASTLNGFSLNDILYIGPKLQTEIFEILLKCRLRNFVITVDIVKMYRQIRVCPEDCQFQHILWRRYPTEEVRDYELLTVTYGVNSAPYLAIRCLHELDIKDSK